MAAGMKAAGIEYQIFQLTHGAGKYSEGLLRNIIPPSTIINSKLFVNMFIKHYVCHTYYIKE
jgi:hypothetical protein